ncbi:30S ribosomal protein S6 [Buchnera aphidicola (Nipponaphis monzeni)]|uniref:Small ribosomal subunit protein bS6 n=1 Tax=Buchnera aphidicola (Nipponaphis monzeni) TaxID=2495405 RepID=A0A455TAU0_9GAMM|nr:30S ribosomal protein S6 [Buchnera aphidicola]BBI01430.1 30S ribosomal protein S6 [Buchnera aphidicola (Nipponaphis monzeni)]
MRHYEIILIIHPNQSEKISEIVKCYSNIIINSKGKIHRLEDWGRRQLAYSINKLHKAHYILINIEVNPELIHELENKFRYDDSIIRNLIITTKNAVTGASPMLKILEENKDSKVGLNKINS